MRETAKPFGLKDQPIEHRDQEALGLIEYAEVLTEFIERCDTPLTIALQGDWGSGKTSLMRLIKDALDNDRYHAVWFNTWQYSQFNMGNSLALSLMSNFSEAIAPNKGESFDKLKDSLWAVSRAVAIGGASLIGQGDTVKTVMDEAERKSSGIDDPTIVLERIKDELARIVAERTATQTEKIVVFVDDLDRLIPERAVELLEAMKIFLDINHCVFVIACDYSVVSAGLKSKFGIAEGELKGKSFFDKIIQVPFKMPIRRYKVNDYIEQLLKQIGVSFDPEQDLDIYSELVGKSVGFNPRTMKRLLNTLQLLNILDSKRQALAATADSNNDEHREHNRHTSRVTFAILCMLEHYEPLYEYLTTGELSHARITALRDGLAKSSEFASIRSKIAGHGDVSKDPAESGNYDDIEILRNAVDFLKTFVNCLQLDDDDNLSDKEIGHLQEMLSLTSMVSAGHDIQEFVPREFALPLKQDLNTRYHSYVAAKSKPYYGKFKMTMGTVYLDLPKSKVGNWKLLCHRVDNSYCFDIRSSEKENVGRLGTRLCEECKWGAGESYYNDNYYYYRFFKVDATADNAYQDYTTELFSRFDTLTKKKVLLFQLCKEVAGDGR